MAERDLLRSFIAEVTSSQEADTALSPVLVGPGDDASVVEVSGLRVTSVDTTVAGVHLPSTVAFEQPKVFGQRAITTALSDLAAMGATPTEVYVALIAPAELPDSSLRQLMDGCLQACRRYGTNLCGGDLTGGATLAGSVTAVGAVDSNKELLLRSGATPGDLVGVSGRLGGSAAGLALLSGLDANLPEEVQLALRERYLSPVPRFDIGLQLAHLGATACIDLSDGIATDAEHVAMSSGVLLEIDVNLLPLQTGVDQVAALLGQQPSQLAATGGEDYELLLTAGPDAAQRLSTTELDITWVGRVLEPEQGHGGELRLHSNGKPIAGWHGFEHRA